MGHRPLVVRHEQMTAGIFLKKIFYGLIRCNEQMPANSSIRHNLPDHTVVVSVSSIRTYSPVTMKCAGYDSGFVCDCSLDGSIKQRCLILTAFAPNPLVTVLFSAAVCIQYITPQEDTCGGYRENNLLSSPLRL